MLFLGLCALEQAFTGCLGNDGYGNVHPEVHVLQNTPSEQWLIQGMRSGDDPALLMLRISAVISLTMISGGEREELPEGRRYLDNFAILVEGGTRSAVYHTFWRMGYAILRVTRRFPLIWIHPICYKPWAVSWADEMYWSARIEGHSHDCARESLDKQLGEEFDGKCGCQLSGR